MEELAASQESALPETPATPTQTTTAQEVDELASGLAAPAPVEDPSEEVEYEGEKYKVNPKLKGALLRQADYTVKTQELAQQRQALEAERQQVVARQQFHEQHLDAVAGVKAIDRQLAQYQNLDWNALSDADPVQAMKLDRQMRELQTQRAQQIAAIEQAQARRDFETQQETVRRHQTAKALLVKDIPGFETPEMQKALLEVGTAAGYRHEELANTQDPRAIKLLHKAYLYDQLVAKAKAAPTPGAPAAATANVVPISRVNGGSAPTHKHPAEMSQAEFNKYRQRQIAKRN